MESKKELLGQLIVSGIHGTSLDRGTMAYLQEIKPGGIILFKRNIESLEQISHLCSSLHNLYDPPPLIAIDQEGGTVNRFLPIFPETPDAYTLGRHADPETVEDLALLTGQALRVIGIDIDFAPVLDLSFPDASNGIGNRSFSIDPQITVDMGGAFLRGLLGQGVAGTLKHFPGLGASSVDSHTSLPIIDKKKDLLELEDMKPFEMLAPMAPLIMVGHGCYPALTVERLPATLSSEIIREILRSKYYFDGVVITDDMEMGALKDFAASGEEAVRALKAGCDMILYCSSKDLVENAHASITAALEEHHLNEEEIEQSLARIFELKRSFILQDRFEEVPARVTEITEKMNLISEKVFSSI